MELYQNEPMGLDPYCLLLSPFPFFFFNQFYTFGYTYFINLSKCINIYLNAQGVNCILLEE